jgi:hypothetical protein
MPYIRQSVNASALIPSLPFPLTFLHHTDLSPFAEIVPLTAFFTVLAALATLVELDLTTSIGFSTILHIFLVGGDFMLLLGVKHLALVQER